MNICNVCFIDTESKGVINGVSTFRNQLSEIFNENQQIKYSILKIKDTFNLSEDIYKYLKQLLNCVLLFNSWPASSMIENIRWRLPHCRIIQIVHDLPWLTFFAGNIEHFLNSAESDFSDYDINTRKFLYYSTIDCIKTFRLCDDIVCLCEDSVKVVNECYDVSLQKIHLIRNGLVDFYRKQNNNLTEISTNNFNKNYYNLLFIGRPTYSKGWDRVIDLGKYIKERNYPMKIISIGTKRQDADILNGLSDYILNIGELARPEIHKAFIECDAVFIPSRHEQCSYVGIEAMMHSKDIFTFGGYGLDNMFNDSNAHIIKDLRQISPDVISYGANARKSYEAFYNMDRMRQSYIDLIIT